MIHLSLLLKKSHVEIDYANLFADLGLKLLIYSYNVNVKDEVLKVYLQKGPFQARNHSFPQTIDGCTNKVQS